MPKPTLTTKKITLKDIAAKAGVSIAAVSMALRDHPNIPPQTASNIKRIADKLKYRPDPALSALAAYRRRNQVSTYHATLGYLIVYHQLSTPSLSLKKYISNYEKGSFPFAARRRALQLGYNLEIFPASIEKREATQLARTLWSRGIKGLIIAGFDTAVDNLSLPWSKFAVIRRTVDASAAQFHSIIPNCLQGMRLVFQRLKTLGYRRPALVMYRNHSHEQHNWLTAYYYAQIALPDFHPSPFWISKSTSDSNWSNSQSKFTRWLHETKPDCLIFQENHQLLPWIKKADYRVPQDIGYVALHLTKSEKYVSGLSRRYHQMGEVAVETLIELLHHNQTGIVKNPRSIQINCEWQQGKTLRKIRKR